jgi:hypothetical protein
MTIRHINVAEQRKSRKAKTFKTPYPMRKPMRTEMRSKPGEHESYERAMKKKEDHAS